MRPDETVTTSLEALGRCLRDLHEAAAQIDPQAFRAWSLGQIRNCVPFDAAWWALGVARDDESIHDIAVLGIVTEMPNRAGSRSFPESHLVWHRESPDRPQPTIVLAFARGTNAHPFGDGERDSLCLLAAQACVAWRNGERHYLLQQVRPRQQAAALADGDGGIHAVLGNFYALLRASWPDWAGDTLPPPLRAACEVPLTVRGHQWSVVDRGPGQLVVTAQPLGAVAALTPREQTVAAAVIEASSLREAAVRLRVSQHTVRNTLARIYGKLGVRNRLELAIRFRHALLGAD
jgi:DNA-binding CsgD family transcriptional regulator